MLLWDKARDEQSLTMNSRRPSKEAEFGQTGTNRSLTALRPASTQRLAPTQKLSEIQKLGMFD